MPLGARRTFRFGFTVALSLALSYGVALPLPFFAPLFAAVLTTAPAPPLRLKGLLGLVLLVLITLGVGLLLTPILIHYPVSGVLTIAAGVYVSSYLTVGLGKGLVGLFLTVGLTMIPAAGLADYGIAVVLIEALVLGIVVAVICQWLVYPWFPEDPDRPDSARTPPARGSESGWIALRATLIVLPPVLLAFSNPALYLPTIIKSVLLGQQGSMVTARAAGRELLGSTFLAGCFAILFWYGLKIWPGLLMFSLWMLLFGLHFASKLYGVSATRFTPSFWQNVAVTLLILVGPAVEDSAQGRDVYRAFAIRFSLFVAVTLYAWASIVVLEGIRANRRDRGRAVNNDTTRPSPAS